MARDNDDGDNDAKPPADANKDRISSSLKRVYDDVASEPLPDRLVDLLDSLRKKSGDSA